MSDIGGSWSFWRREEERGCGPGQSGQEEIGSNYGDEKAMMLGVRRWSGKTFREMIESLAVILHFGLPVATWLQLLKVQQGNPTGLRFV